MNKDKSSIEYKIAFYDLMSTKKALDKHSWNNRYHNHDWTKPTLIKENGKFVLTIGCLSCEDSINKTLDPDLKLSYELEICYEYCERTMLFAVWGDSINDRTCLNCYGSAWPRIWKFKCSDCKESPFLTCYPFIQNHKENKNRECNGTWEIEALYGPHEKYMGCDMCTPDPEPLYGGY